MASDINGIFLLSNDSIIAEERQFRPSAADIYISFPDWGIIQRWSCDAVGGLIMQGCVGLVHGDAPRQL